ncbi:MAG: hypothetical protein QF837_02850 [Acidimicrobiales bacterium]|nr:hypothetical protein [Acidimicrobiaceae bacterium]MDG2352850.1 hypothetical protein [Acidimicrobiales bacterium]MDP6161597.1 hypothetical protein [Acidimicrobiales bacterium]MDP6285109.1 hypothetical protein [Acidimicrobiales bacterium]HJL91016.1 hypothetical protein [Acidimicrobiales bacterium]
MTRRNSIIICSLLAIGIAVLVLAGLIADGDDNDIVLNSNPGISELIPSRGDEVIAQTNVGVVFSPTWTGEIISIGDKQIPLDQQRVEPALNSVVFRPEAGKVIERLPAGNICASIVYWEVQTPSRRSSLNWCFRVIG